MPQQPSLTASGRAGLDAATISPAPDLRSAPMLSASALGVQYVDVKQQRHSGELGMWLFLITEFMLFAAFFAAYLVYRHIHPQGFELGSQRMNLTLGTLNTAILLTSSFTMALIVDAAGTRRLRTIVLLLLTLTLGLVFLGIKGLEYYHKWVEHLIPFAGWEFGPTGPDRIGQMAFFNLYFLLTGMHAVHMLIGCGLLLSYALLEWRDRVPMNRSAALHNVGLYWHFVDLVWVFLFPFFYLVS